MTSRRVSLTWPAAIAAVTISSAAAHSQANPAQTGSGSNARNVVTVTGCMRSTDQTMVGTSGIDRESAVGTTGNAVSTNDMSIKFVLVNVTETSSPGEAAGTVRTKSGSAANEYRLDGDDRKLKAHTGHKVEIEGTIANPGSTSADNASVLSTAPRLKVMSVRTVAASCQ
jgi:hypothetical protein